MSTITTSRPSSTTSPIDRALAALRSGGMVVVADDATRENEADLIWSAATATTEQLALAIRCSSGLICVPMRASRLDALGIPMMTATNTDPHETAFTVSTDAREGVTTGICAADRARTIRLLADARTRPGDLVHPGHVFPLRAREEGVLVRRGHTEAAVDLMRLAGLPEVGVLVELVNDDGTMKRGSQVIDFAAEHDLPVISISDIAALRWRQEQLVEEVATTTLPTRYGVFTAHAFRDVLGTELVVLTVGEVDGTDVVTRVHSGCVTGDVLGSLRCDCGFQLDTALQLLQDEGRGALVYLPSQEGRGIGLASKLEAYALQDAGLDTVEANQELGLPVDARDYGAASQALRALGVRSVRLLTNNPEKVEALEALGVPVTERVGRAAHVTEENRRYLCTKRDRMGHDLRGLEAVGADGSLR